MVDNVYLFVKKIGSNSIFLLFQEFIKTKQESRDPRVKSNMELVKHVANFLISLRKFGGGEYEPDSLT